MKNSSHRLSVVTLLLFPGFALITQGVVGQQSLQVLAQHDTAQPYRALVMCVDSSLSPTKDQFRKSLAILEEVAERDVTYNDLVWLIDIQSNPQPAKLFVMPASSHRRSASTSAADALRNEKAVLINAIRATSQVSGDTDLKDPFEAALDILRAHPRATERILIVASDFLTDMGSGKVSIEPPTPVRPESAARVIAWLFVTYPKDQYLRRLHMSQSELLVKVEEKWAADLRRRGASRVNVRPVDSIPVTMRTVTELRPPAEQHD